MRLFLTSGSRRLSMMTRRSGSSSIVSGFITNSAASKRRPQSTPAAALPRSNASADDSSAAAFRAASAAGDPSLAPFIAQIADKRFTCTQCGKCCTGAGDVHITEEEALAIARKTRRPVAAFTKSRSPAVGWRLLRDRPRDPLGGCIFLGSDGKTCTIHDVRPAQCRLYPWWPGLMAAEEWQAEADAVCEGFFHADAPETDVVDAARQLREATKLEAARDMATRRRGGGGGGGAVMTIGARSAADMMPRSDDKDAAAPGPPPPLSRKEQRKRDRADAGGKKGGGGGGGDLYGRLMALLGDQEEEERRTAGGGQE
jgi:Fe-S-cluster containining protein